VNGERGYRHPRPEQSACPEQRLYRPVIPTERRRRERRACPDDPERSEGKSKGICTTIARDDIQGELTAR
jgi:hypothetical protein